MKKIIVIGAGIGGLSAGIYGRLAGYEVDIYEKNPVAGGQCMGWNRKGHHIDNCIHWLTGTREGSAGSERSGGVYSSGNLFVCLWYALCGGGR